MKALLVIDMQVGLFEGNPPRYDADGVIRRVNEIARITRATGGAVIFIQHEDKGSLERGTRGWEILPPLSGRIQIHSCINKPATRSTKQTWRMCLKSMAFGSSL